LKVSLLNLSSADWLSTKEVMDATVDIDIVYWLTITPAVTQDIRQYCPRSRIETAANLSIIEEMAQFDAFFAPSIAWHADGQTGAGTVQR